MKYVMLPQVEDVVWKKQPQRKNGFPGNRELLLYNLQTTKGGSGEKKTKKKIRKAAYGLLRIRHGI